MLVFSFPVLTEETELYVSQQNAFYFQVCRIGKPASGTQPSGMKLTLLYGEVVGDRRRSIPEAVGLPPRFGRGTCALSKATRILWFFLGLLPCSFKLKRSSRSVWFMAMERLVPAWQAVYTPPLTPWPIGDGWVGRVWKNQEGWTSEVGGGLEATRAVGV